MPANMLMIPGFALTTATPDSVSEPQCGHFMAYLSFWSPRRGNNLARLPVLERHSVAGPFQEILVRQPSGVKQNEMWPRFPLTDFNPGSHR
jgi:hypothetical protein